MRKISELSSRWYVALAVTAVLGAAILLPSLGRPGLWEPGERSLADRVAPPEDIQLQQDAQKRRVEAAQPKKPGGHWVASGW